MKRKLNLCYPDSRWFACLVKFKRDSTSHQQAILQCMLSTFMSWISIVHSPSHTLNLYRFLGSFISDLHSRDKEKCCLLVSWKETRHRLTRKKMWFGKQYFGVKIIIVMIWWSHKKKVKVATVWKCSASPLWMDGRDNVSLTCGARLSVGSGIQTQMSRVFLKIGS